MSKASKVAPGTSQSLDLALKQTLTLTPQLQQAIKLLNMGNLDLNVEISNMLAQNIMLERNLLPSHPRLVPGQLASMECMPRHNT